MIDLLPRLFVRDYKNVGDPVVRGRYGTMVSVVCILVNLLLSIGKLIVGTLLGSIAITADALNNMSDAGASLVSLISFRISAKPADRDHPFGHARMEYVASLIVSFFILLVGFELFKSSVEKIITPVRPDDRYITVSMILLGIAVLVKLWVALFNRRIGRRIGSSLMRATAIDSLFDCISTGAVLLSTVLYAVFGWYFLDGYFGLFVALLIFFAGGKILNETKNSILGERPVDETVQAIRRIVSEYPEALGVHDMIVHNYGPGHVIASLHVEVDGALDVFLTHDTVDNIERRIAEELSIQCTIHADPIVVGDPEVDRLHDEVNAIACGVFEGILVHDFRFVRGVTHSNLIFDVAVPFECPMTDGEICEKIEAAVRKRHETFRTVITVDRE